MSIPNDSNQGVHSRFQNRLAPMGFDYFAICSINAGDFLSVSGLPKHYTTNFPECWVSHYVHEKMYQNDPVLKAAVRTSYATDWRDLAAAVNQNVKGSDVLHAASDFGVRYGIGLAAHHLDGSVLVVSLASKDAIKHSDECRSRITLESMWLAEEFAGTVSEEPAEYFNLLSCREEECLKWAALGKSSGEIGDILSISQNTVDFHIKRAMIKLNANSRVYAIVRALRLGLINL